MICRFDKLKTLAVQGRRALIVLCLSFWCLQTVQANIPTLVVHSVGDDYPPSASYCDQLPTDLCNLRSAWLACMEIQSACTIVLPEVGHLFLNATFGSLHVLESSNVTIQGSGSVITPGGVPMQFMNYTAPVYPDTSTPPALQMTNMTIFGFGNPLTKLGGALYLDGDLTLSIVGVHFVNNTALMGGAIYVTNNSLSTSILSSSFHNCSATYSGGAIYVDQRVRSLSMVNSHFESCGAGDKGSAIAINSDNPGASVVSCVFTACQGTDGTLYLGSNNHNANIKDCLFSGNFVKNQGGAVLVDGSESGNFNVSISNTIFEHCTAKYGGGVYFSASNDYSSITSSVFTHCRATQAYGAIAFIGTSAYNTVADLLIDNCQAFNIGGIALSGSVDHFTLRDTTLSSCTSSDDRSVAGSGGGGGAGWISGSANLTLLNTYISNCTSAALGGGLLVQSVTRMIMSGVHFDQCTSVLGGGGLSLAESTYVVIQGSSFSSCASTAGNGGAVSAESTAQLSLSNVTILGCSAQMFGGGIYCAAYTSVAIADSMVNEGDATSGGGIYFGTSLLSISVLNVTIAGNTASADGGGMYVGAGNANMLLGGINVKSNSATEYGGGIYYEAALPNLVITDLDSALTSQVLQYLIVPAVSSSSTNSDAEDYLYYKKVSSTEAFGYILTFAAAPVLPEWYVLKISSGSTIFTYTLGAPLPGVGAPSLEIKNSTFEIWLSGDDCLSCDGEGFRLYVTPITDHAITPTVFDSNSAGIHGGGVYMNGGLSYSLLLNTHFVQNKATVDGGGLYMFSNNNNIMLLRVLLAINTADSGGGIYLFGDIEQLVMSYVSLFENSATNGGGLFVNFNVGGSISNSVFDNNEAVIGGGAVLQTTQVTLSFVEVEFAYNFAESGGGISINANNGAKVYQYTQNPITFQNCTFLLNEATNGGAAYIDTGNVVSFQDSRFTNNTASGAISSSGGAISMNSLNQVTLTSNTFEYNVAAYSGGGISSRDQNTIYMAAGLFQYNQAAIGGGLFIQDNTGVMFVDTTVFSSNIASGGGGAIASVNTRLWSVSITARVIVDGNRASRGSALLFKSLISGSSITRFDFTNNVAAVGGTVFWLFDSLMRQEPAGLLSSSNVWHNNIAPYGNVSATQGVQLVGPNQYTVQSYLSALTPPLVYYLKDYYGHYIPLTGSTSVVPTVNTIAFHDCSTNNPSIAGSDTLGVVFQNGSATFDSMQVYCYPGGTFALNVSANLGDQVSIIPTSQSAVYYVTKRTQILLRSCAMGEKIQSAVCVPCPIGSYSLANYVDVNTQCIPCGSIAGIQSCQTSVITLKSGYWRRFTSSNAVQACPQELNGCKGGTATGDGLCKAGFTGPLCAVCADGYFTERNNCVSCSGPHSLPTSTIVFIVVVVSITLASLTYTYRRYHQLKRITKERTVHSPSGLESLSHMQFNLLDKALIWLAAHYKPVITKLKITVVTYQIITAVPGVFSVTFPSKFTSFLHSVTFVNLNFVSLLSLQCSTSYTFIDELIVSTLLPIGITIVMFIAFVLQIVYVAKRLEQNPNRGVREARDQFDAIKNQYLNYLFYLTYLILPSISTRIFQTFLCTNIDPDNEYPFDDNLYLTADMNISCTSQYYYRGKAYAIFMIFVYPIGIPSLYMYLLYQSRSEIRDRVVATEDDEVSELMEQSQDNAMSDIKDLEDCRESETVANISNPMLATGTDAETKYIESTSDVIDVAPATPIVSSGKNEKRSVSLKLSAPAERLAFLWVAFKPQYWYWEIIETTRRLMLTAVLSVTGSGTSQQAVLALLLALFYIKLYSYFSPYEQRPSDITAEIGQYQILFTFLGALITMDSLLQEKYNSTVDGLLILFNLGVLFAFGYYELSDLYNEMVELRKIRNDKIAVLTTADSTANTEIEMINRKGIVSK